MRTRRRTGGTEGAVRRRRSEGVGDLEEVEVGRRERRGREGGRRTVTNRQTDGNV